MNGARIRVVMAKDLRELTANPMVVIPMVLVPVILCIAVPCVITVITLSSGADQVLRQAGLMAKLVDIYQVPAILDNPGARFLYVVLNYTFLPLFMIVPLMMTSLVSANAIVGEKERKTLETLLSTPLSNRELIAAKLFVSFLPAVALSWVVFAVFFLVTNGISLLMIRMVIVRSLIWIPSLLLLSPGISAIALSLALLVSLKAKTFQSAQQVTALVVLPLVAVVYAQIAGVVIVRAAYVVILGIVLLGAAAVLILRVLPRFTREGIISTL